MSQRVFISITAAALIAGTGMLQAKGIFKRYPVQSGMIFYDINITGHSANGFSTQTHGIARLVFDQWGARELKEEDATEVQKGDYNETRDIHSLTKMDHGTIYTVDYDDQTIYKTRDRSLDLSIAEGEDLSQENIQLIKEMKGHKIGTGKVAGFPCELWKAKDQKICLYKGIPLSITIDAPGFHSERKAVQVVLNRKIPEDQFKLPDFPVVVDEEYTSNPAAETRTEDYIASVKDLQAKMQSLGINPESEDQNLTPEQERKVIDILGERYLKKQKRLLPKLLVTLEAAKKCVAKAENGDEAKHCIEPVNKIDEELGDRTEHFDYAHFSEKKPRILKSLDQEISYLKVTNECVQKHDKTSDVILCTEGNLGEDEEENSSAR
ncbi:hypothetical protein [Nitratifractor salsuginis]|uniref:DUF4412 domain-containing protein n=1 Tax=Nitratifractor salsuginis (strain DSM 16511 / JCM 12458 / E9I37-1) TaxID=749222 RepID=E6X3K6_NITSE|nr:hypothetical protein [Nitratifractor salsuginis]ADV46283.1 hypothetical protein Nitsa_1025 [Nitratifractor salsuginis DSM 16511]